jgi:hypothetical protein
MIFQREANGAFFRSRLVLLCGARFAILKKEEIYSA